MGTFWRHMKTQEAGDAAIGLWTRMLSHCADNGRTVLSRKDIRTLVAGDANGQRKLKTLLSVGLVDAVEDGYTPHDWADHNPGISAPSTSNSGEGDDESVTESVTGCVTESVTRSVMNHPERLRSVTKPLSRPKTQDPRPKTQTERAGEVRPDSEVTDWAVSTRFRKLYLEARGVDPALGGKNVGGFHERLANTANARGLAPLTLLADAFAAWASTGFDGLKKSTPYAAFVARFDDLVSPTKPDPRRVGFLPPSTAEELGDGTDLDEFFGTNSVGAEGAE